MFFHLTIRLSHSDGLVTVFTVGTRKYGDRASDGEEGRGHIIHLCVCLRACARTYVCARVHAGVCLCVRKWMGVGVFVGACIQTVY